jgi:hypothetical protein
MTTMPLPVTPAAPGVAGLTPEVVTTSSLLTMPAVWNTVVEHALPASVLLERYLIVLATCALVVELVRRLGAGGALGPGPVAPEMAGPGSGRRSSAAASASRASAAVTTARQVDGFGEPGELGAPPALDGSVDAAGEPGALDDLQLDGLQLDGLQLDDLQLDDLAPLDLTADPFAESA